MTKISVLIWFVPALICPMAPAQTATLDELLGKVAKWDYDQSREVTRAVADMVEKANGSAAQTRDIEQRFIALLTSDASLAGKDFVCKQLSLMGTEASVPALSSLLVEPKTSDMARYALERIPGQAADRALREALAKTSDKTRIGIIDSLGRRRDAASAAALRPLALGPEQATAAAALSALGKIADPAAIQVLSDAYAKTGGDLKVTAAQAYLDAAQRLAAGGKTADAVAIYKKLYAAGEPSVIRAGALHGLARAGGAQSTAMLLEALHGDDARLQAVAIHELAPTSARQFAAEMPKLNEAGQVRVLGILAERGDTSALPVFTAALKGSSQPVRIAALAGLARVGNASVVATLAGIAAGDNVAEQTAARASLASIRGKDVDQAVVDAIAGAEPKVRLELIRAAGQRYTAAASPVLIKMARDADSDVRRESLRALHDTASASDVPGLVALVAGPVQAGDRTEAVRSLAAVLRRSDPSRIQDVIAAYTPASDVESRAALMQVMGQSGNAQALPVLRTALGDQNAEVKRAAILALSDWSDDTPVPDLLASARTASTPAHQALALRGVVRLVGLPGSPRTPLETVKVLADVLSLAKQADEKRAVLSLLPRYAIKESLDLAGTLVNDSEVGAEAKAAVARLQRTMSPRR
jgi:HEAT repeat protein